MELGTVFAKVMIGREGKGVVGKVYVVLVEGFAEEEGVEGPDMEARQVPGLQALQDCQGAIRLLRHQRFHVIQRPAVPHRRAGCQQHYRRHGNSQSHWSCNAHKPFIFPLSRPVLGVIT